jgi:3-deoxy-D-manno-octulosonate 8-phosphate phosphatase (KDO 8-P phosphatase)
MDLLKTFKNITTFVFDVDGVLTDGTVLLLENGLQARRMNIKDGLALQLAMKYGRVVVVSGGYSEPVLARLQYLGVQEVFLGVKDKLSLLQDYFVSRGVAWQHVLYMGDDLPDLAVLKMAGLACCPADAVPEVQTCCHYIAARNGGEGCVREVIEKVLKLNGAWHTESGLVSQ